MRLLDDLESSDELNEEDKDLLKRLAKKAGTLGKMFQPFVSGLVCGRKSEK